LYFWQPDKISKLETKSEKNHRYTRKTNQNENFSKKKGRLGPNSLRGKRFHTGHRDIMETASHHFKKASVPLKIYLKSLTILEKASISLKKSSKIMEIFIKAPFLNKSLNFSGNAFKMEIDMSQSL
jgi:hypothetical protein